MSRGTGTWKMPMLTPLVVLLLAASTGAWGQGPVALDRLEVVLWPEYDRPAVLVMLRGFVDPGVALPAEVAVPIPESAGMPHAVAKRGPDDTLLVAPYTREVEAKWASIRVVTDSPEIRIEYYLPLRIRDDVRSFTYQWPGGLEVRQLAYEVQQPRGATDFVVQPPAGRQLVGTNGLVYHLAELGSWSSDASATIEIGYSKTGSELAAKPAPSPAPLQSSHPAAEDDEAAGGPSTSAGWPTWWPVALVLIVVAVGGAWWAGRKSTAAPPAGDRDADQD
jgi:hypothetical protein